MLSTQEISEILTRPASDLEATCGALIQRANDNGGRDNISVILIKVESRNAETKGLLGQLMNWVK